MSALDFLRRKHEVLVAHFDHGTQECSNAKDFLKDYCQKHNLEFVTATISDPDPPKGQSLEEHWRCQRYKFLFSLCEPVVTAHNLDDCVETWIWSSLHGQPKLIPFHANNVVRPFMLTEKSRLIKWATDSSVPWYEDASNLNICHIRNYIRQQMMPHVQVVNPGIKKMIKKKLMQKLSLHDQC